MELKGDVTRQRRLEAIDKLLSVLTLIVGSVFGLQALGLDGESSRSRLWRHWALLLYSGLFEWSGGSEVVLLAAWAGRCREEVALPVLPKEGPLL